MPVNIHVNVDMSFVFCLRPDKRSLSFIQHLPSTGAFGLGCGSGGCVCGGLRGLFGSASTHSASCVCVLGSLADKVRDDFPLLKGTAA